MYSHGCTTFIADNDDTVLVVAGGWTNDGVTTSVETLVLSRSGQTWTQAEPLPTERSGTVLVTHPPSRVLCVGGYGVYDYQSPVLSWTGEGEWEETGEQVARRFHTAVVVPLPSC